MSPFGRKNIVFKAKWGFNCLKIHVVKGCTKRCDCGKCRTIDVGKHFFMLNNCFFSTVFKSPRASALGDRNRNGVRNSDVAENSSFSVGGARLVLLR